MRTKKEVEAAFSPNPKLTQGQSQIVMNMQVSFKDLAFEICDSVPESADRTSALRKLLEAKMMITQAITHGVPPEQKGQQQEKKDAVNVAAQT